MHHACAAELVKVAGGSDALIAHVCYAVCRLRFLAEILPPHGVRGQLFAVRVWRVRA